MALKKRKIIFITGFQKNCGKTTFLNYILSSYKSSDKVFCASVGLDDKYDLNLEEKPSVLIKKNWLCLTNSAFLKNLYDYEIIDFINSSIMGGNPIIISPKNDIKVRLISLGSNYMLYEIINNLKDINYFFIDGAFDRITQISFFKDSYFYYVFKIQPSNINEVYDKIMFLETIRETDINTKYYDFLMKINSDVFIDGDIAYFKGALTLSKLEKIPLTVKKLVICDFTKIFLNFRDYKKLISDFKVYLASAFNLAGYVINFCDVDKKDFEKKFSLKTI